MANEILKNCNYLNTTVFKQFKNKIYDSVINIHSPINNNLNDK